MMKILDKNPEMKQELLKKLGVGPNPKSSKQSVPSKKPQTEGDEMKAIFESMKTHFAKAQDKEDNRPKLVPFVPPRRKRQHCIEFYLRKKAHALKNKTSFIKNTIKPNKHTSQVENLSSLEPVFLKDLMVHKVHHGKFLICRVIEDPYRVLASILLVEDENGDVEDLCIYNYAVNVDCRALFPKGTVIFILEPFFTTTNGDETCIRVDSPSDIRVDEYEYSGKFKGELNALIGSTDPEDIKKKGNDYFKAKQYHLALRYYQVALNFNPKQEFIFRLNCSAVYLELELYFQAYVEARKALDSISISDERIHREKAHFRMGRAAYLMRQWQTALESLNECMKENPRNLEAEKLLKATNQRIKEESTGRFNFYEIFKQHKYDKSFNIDVADYSNMELLQIEENPSKGRFIVAREDIPRGTLLMVSKAFSFGKFQRKRPREKIPVCSSNLVINTIDPPSHYENLSMLFRRVHGNPFIAKEVYALFPGESLNRKEIPGDSIVDVSRLECISSYNSFEGEYWSMHQMTQGTPYVTSGLWIRPAQLNHSCVPSTTRFFFGDVMIMFSARRIMKGEEITDNYSSCFNSLEERETELRKYGFECKCELCQSERNDPKRKEREKLLLENKSLGDVEKLMKNGEKVRLFVEKLEKEYIKEEKLAFWILEPLVWLENFYYESGKFLKCVGVLQKIYNILKDILPEMALVKALRIKDCYQILKNAKEAEKWQNIIMQDDFFHDGEFREERLEDDLERLF